MVLNTRDDSIAASGETVPDNGIDPAAVACEWKREPGCSSGQVETT